MPPWTDTAKQHATSAALAVLGYSEEETITLDQTLG